MKIKKQKDDFKQFVLDQLAGIPDIICQRMFGGFGLYQGMHFFGILHGGRLYFKTDNNTRTRYEARQMQAFSPSEKQTLKRYYEVPVDILEDQDTLKEWAKAAIRVAMEK